MINNRISKILYWIISLPLFFISSAVIITYVFFSLVVFENDWTMVQSFALFFSLALVAGWFVSILPWVFRKKEQRLKAIKIRWLFTGAMACFIVFLLIDAPPLKKDFSEKDIFRNTEAERLSFKTLQPFLDHEKKEFGIDRELFTSYDFLSNIGSHEDKVLEAWEMIQNEREVINKSEAFDIVLCINPEKKITHDMPFLSFTSLLDIQAIYLAYTALKIQQGNTREGLHQLERLYNVARKGLVTTPILVHKFLWFAVISRSIETAYLIEQMEYVDSDSRSGLSVIFTPLTKDEVSMEKVFIGEYLFGESAFDAMLKESCQYFFTLPWTGKSSFLDTLSSGFINRFFLNRNRTKRTRKQLFDTLIMVAKKTPPDVQMYREAEKEFHTTPTLRNLGGWYVVDLYAADFGTYISRASFFKVKSDIFSVYLSQRSGKNLKINDYLSGNPYEIKEIDGCLVTAGPDKRINTDDDVTIGQNCKKM